jgi:FAD:protein FMN transferase
VRGLTFSHHIFAAAATGAITGASARPAAADYEWRGVAMGADAKILFSGIEASAASSAAALVEAEIVRLESALSLFRADSELCCLNREGSLPEPSADMRRAMALALNIATISDGLFDPTGQSLWEA